MEAFKLAQAQEALKDQPHVRLERIEVNGGKTAGLPFPPQTFDLITCTNALHDIRDPVAFLSDIGTLLVPGGQLVLEDFARRRPALLWGVFEWLARRVENGHIRAYTLAEAWPLYVHAGLRVASGKAFPSIGSGTVGHCVLTALVLYSVVRSGSRSQTRSGREDEGDVRALR